MSANFIDRFHRQLHSVLADEIHTRTLRLAQGAASLTQGDILTVAEKYAAQVAYLRALHDIVEKCQELEVDMYGTK